MSMKKVGSLTVSADSEDDDVTVVEFPATADVPAVRQLMIGIPGAWWAALVNRVVYSDEAPRWQFGSTALMRNLAQRGLLAS